MPNENATPPDPIGALRKMGEMFQGESEALLRVGHDVRNFALGTALAEAANVLSVLSLAFLDCAEGENPEPMQSLAEAVTDWISARCDYVPASEPADGVRPDHEVSRFADDGNPHHPD